jgi:hypothetical protein
MRFGTRTVALVQRNINLMLGERCTLERETGQMGLMGEPLHTWEVVVDNIPCRIIRAGQSFSSAAAIVGSQEALIERYRLICPTGTPFTLEDRVRFDDGRLYQVVQVEDGLTEGVFVSAIITRVRD